MSDSIRNEKFIEIEAIFAALERACDNKTLEQVDYDFVISIIKSITPKTGESIFRDVDHAYMLEDAHCWVEDYFSSRQDRLPDYRTLPINYEHLVSEFEERQDSEIAESNLWEYLIEEHVEDIMEKAKSEQGKAPEKAPQSPLHGPAREALIDEQIEQMNRTEAAKIAKAEGNLNAFVMARKAFFYVEYKNRFQKNTYLAGYAAGCYEVYSLLFDKCSEFAIFGRKMSGDAITKYLKENVEITRKDAFSDMPKNDYTTGVLTGRFKAWESAYEVVSKENKEVLNANQTDDKEIPPEWFGRS